MGCKGPGQGKGCNGMPMQMMDMGGMWIMGGNGGPVPCTPCGPSFQVGPSPFNQGGPTQGPPPYNADDTVEDRDVYNLSQQWSSWSGKGDRWKGGMKGAGKKGGKGKQQDDMDRPDRFDRMSVKERQRQWDHNRENIRQALETNNLDDARYYLNKGWHPFAGAITKKLLQAKTRLHKINLVATGTMGRERGSPVSPKRGQRRRQQPQVPQEEDANPSIQAKWWVHAPSTEDGRQSFDDQGAGSADIPADLREIQLKVKGTVPAGCLLKINMNGHATSLKPEIRAKRGEVLPAASKDETTFHLKRPDAEDDFAEPADASSWADQSQGAGTPATARLAPCLEFDACAMVARTDLKLQTPTIELIEVHDTAVVLSLRNLTGQRFELTVYASGGEETAGAASTLVQCGPVRGSESVHRISPLEASQVYVAWVKVFNESKTAESKQKGFKTPEAKQKTIWDEKDHVILGVAEDATAKEIVKAWRAQSLKYHPDKVPDEQKEEAEEMMKRLNLAKVNMMKFARPNRDEDENTPAAEANPDDFDDMDTPGTPEGAPPQDVESEPEFGPKASSAQSDETEAEDEDEASSIASEDDEFFGERNARDVLDGRLRCSLTVEATNPPRLRVLERGYTVLVLEASGLPLGCTAQVLKAGDDDVWTEASEKRFAKTPSLRFMLSGLEENTPYRLRLRTSMDIEPLRFENFAFAEQTKKDAGDEESEDAPEAGQEEAAKEAEEAEEVD